MNEEEKDSIEILKNTDLDINTIDLVDLHTYNYAVKTVLNLLENKDKIIDEMAETLSNQFNNYEPCWLDDEMECKKYKNCEDCIKQYFENKVTDTNVGERKVENGN